MVGSWLGGLTVLMLIRKKAGTYQIRKVLERMKSWYFHGCQQCKPAGPWYPGCDHCDWLEYLEFYYVNGFIV